MSKEHITSHAMHLWDMRMIELMRQGKAQEIINEMPEFCEQAIAESDGGALTWFICDGDTRTTSNFTRIRYHYWYRKCNHGMAM